MFRLTATFLAFSFAIQPALADEAKDPNFARYSVSGSFSPFGGSLNFGYNSCKKTSYQFSIGGFPEAEAPFKVEVDGSEYTVKGSSSWAGAFVQHRPVEGSEWFRLVFGFGVGQIKNSLDDGNGNTYTQPTTLRTLFYTPASASVVKPRKASSGALTSVFSRPLVPTSSRQPAPAST